MKEKVTVLICVHSNNDFHDNLLDRSINSLVNKSLMVNISVVNVGSTENNSMGSLKMACKSKSK